MLRRLSNFCKRRSYVTSLGGTNANRPEFVDPSEIQEKIDKLPYFVERTAVGKCLPVYLDIKHAGSQLTTIVRRIYGSIGHLSKDIRECVGEKAKITIRQDLMQIKIKGRHTREVKKFLTEKGF